MPHQPTDEQREIISRANDGSLMLSAYAGCAKTSTMEMLAQHIREPGLSTAFNSKTAKELEKRLPRNFVAKTLNGIGHGAWMRRPGIPTLKLDDQKTTKILKEILKETSTKLSPEQWQWTQGLTRQAMQRGLVPSGVAAENPQLDDTPEAWSDLAAEAGIPADELRLTSDTAREVLRRDIALALQGIISFDDQIYCPTVLGGLWPKFPVVMVDESQDLSPMNHEMLRLCLRPQGRLISVGDQRQAIYAWRGADAQSMTNLRALAEGWIDLPLTLTFRCPKAIVARCQDHAPGFRAAESNAQGQVWPRIGEARMDEGEIDWSWTWKDLLGKMPHEEIAPVTFLCRNNAPLMSMAFKLIRSGIGCHVLGRDLGRGLVALSRKIMPEDETSRESGYAMIADWEQHELELARLNDREKLVDSILDRAECLRAVFESANVRTSGQLRDALGHLFSKESGLVTLSSIHKAKGLEWPFVVHLDPWRIPSKQSKREAELGRPQALEQEWNLKYVCETRTQHTLVMTNVKEFRI